MKPKSTSMTTARRLHAAEADLKAAEVTLVEVVAKEDQALATAADHAAWRASRDAAEIEVNRLRKLVAKLTADIEEEQRQQAAAAQQQLEDDAEAAATEAAEIIRSNLAQIQTLVRETIRVSAQADIIVEHANRGRAEGAPPILPAELRTRSSAALPEEVVAENIVTRAVFEESGHMLDEDTASKLIGGQNGLYVIAGAQVQSRVVMRKFKRVEFLPEQKAAYTDRLATSISLPALVAGAPQIWPGNSFFHYSPEAVLELLGKLDQAAAAAVERTTEVRFEPIDQPQRISQSSAA
jgi:hypothetical protein